MSQKTSVFLSQLIAAAEKRRDAALLSLRREAEVELRRLAELGNVDAAKAALAEFVVSRKGDIEFGFQIELEAARKAAEQRSYERARAAVAAARAKAQQQVEDALMSVLDNLLPAPAPAATPTPAAAPVPAATPKVEAKPQPKVKVHSGLNALESLQREAVRGSKIGKRLLKAVSHPVFSTGVGPDGRSLSDFLKVAANVSDQIALAESLLKEAESADLKKAQSLLRKGWGLLAALNRLERFVGAAETIARLADETPAERAYRQAKNARKQVRPRVRK